MNAVVLALHGLLVQETVDTVEPVLAGCLVPAEDRHDEPPATRLVLDVSQVSVCDPAGAALLLRVADLARARGGELRLAAPSQAILSWTQVADGIARIAAFASVDGAVEADPRDLLIPASTPGCACIEPQQSAPREAGPRETGAGHARPRWSVNPSGRGRSRPGPASPRR